MKKLEKHPIVEFCDELEEITQKAYADGVTLEEAEKLAARMLQAQVTIAKALEGLDLDSRMQKTGVKTVRATIYFEEIQKHEKKPSEAYLESAVDKNDLVMKAQDSYDEADSKKSSLQTYLQIFKDAHIYFRGIAKGSFNG